MHTTNPDLVGIKTAVRQLAVRLENEAKSAAQWASLARNRGVPEVSARLESVIASLDTAVASAAEVHDLLFEAQEHDPTSH
jgi:predicted metal-dependent HD superfamily phosphohydrolase